MSRFADAPPPLEAPQLPEEPPKWPKVMGIISIAWGSLWLLCGLGGVGMMAFMSSMRPAESASSGGPPSFPKEMLPSSFQMLLMVIGLPWAILLIASGIATVTRRRAGRPLHLVYALGGLVLVGVSTMAGVSHMSDVQRWVAANPDNMFAKSHTNIGDLIGLAFGVFMGAAWPLFCIIWFAPAKHSPEINAPEHL